MQRKRALRQRELFDPDGPDNVLEGERREELLGLLAQLLRETAAGPGTGGAHEQDHG